MKLKITYQFIVLLSVLIGLSSCGKDSACFKGTGKVMKEQRLISEAVTSIKTADNIDIIFTQSSIPSLTIEGGANLLPYIYTEVSGNQLSIYSDNKCGLFRDYNIPITVYLSLPNISNIDYTGQGNITCTNRLVLDKLNISCSSGTGNITLDIDLNEISIQQHSGPADFTISGSSKSCYIYTLGEGWFYLNNLLAETAQINHNGTGDVSVNVSDYLLVELRSLGDVIYTGSPVLDVSNHSGSGKILNK